MSNPEKDKRLDEVLDMIARMASLDFSRRLPLDMNPNDPMDAVIYGLNMLSEELHNNVIEKKRLTDINHRLEEFAFTASHDLKSPLNSLHGLIALIQVELGEQSQTNPELKKLLEMLEATSHKMRGMVDGILNYSRVTDEMLSKSNLNLLDELNEISSIFSGQNVRIQIPSNLPEIQYNKIALTQIVQNLLGNAIKFNDKNVCEIAIGCEENENYYQIGISDNGPGIDKKYHDKVFELFVHLTHRKMQDGSGIGLATVKKLVEGSGGRIWIDSDQGEGCTFYFTIPKTLTPAPTSRN